MTLEATAPVRVCDLGGWTDTWFAGHGQVCNVAVRPGARAVATPRPGGRLITSRDLPGPNPVLERIAEEIGADDVEVEVSAGVPPGSGLGSSAAVGVAVAAVVDRLAAERDGRRPRRPMELAELAFGVEAAIRQTGVQDHVAAAMGGISWIDVRFPSFGHERVPLPKALGEMLVVIFLGARDSSAVHERLTVAEDDRRLEALRRCAADGRAALVANELEAYGAALCANTRLQAELHPSLVSADARAAIEAAAAAGATGWKVNGAGGEGGSVAFLGDRRRIVPAVREAVPAAEEIAVRPTAAGVRVRRVS